MKNFIHNNKILFITVSFIIIFGLLGFGIDKYTLRNSQPEIMGANSSTINSATNPSKTIEKILLNGDYALVGDGCSQNKFGTKCELNYQNTSKQVLKSCLSESDEKCSFYTYSLGKISPDGIYIFQNYTDTTEELTDIIEYKLIENTLTPVDTVLYENTTNPRCNNNNSTTCIKPQEDPITTDNIKTKINQNNQHYLNSINKYN
jgi:hypothetical protein